MKISIIIPIYKLEHTISRCLDSLLNQTYKNIEIICVGDKDVDDPTFPIIEEYCKKHKLIKFYLQDSRGTGNARNYALSKITGDLIFFLDGDDYIARQCLEKLYLSMKKYNSDMAICGFTRKDEITKKIYGVEMISNDYEILNINEKNIENLAFINPAPWGKLFKKEILIDIYFDTEKKLAGEDLLFYLNYIPNVKRISFVRESLIDYMVAPNSLTGITNLEFYDNLKKKLVLTKNKYEQLNLKEYLKLLDYIVFLHIAIGEPERCYSMKVAPLNMVIKDNKKFLNLEFKNWKKIKINYGKFNFKSISIYFGKILYKIGLFNLYIKLYSFLNNKMKVSVKW